MKKLDKQRKITLLALSLALMVAVYLNWQYSRDGADLHIMTNENPQETATNTQVNDQESNRNTSEITVDTNTDIDTEGDLLATGAEDEIKNYGDAQLVSVSGKGAKKYFEETRLSRQKSRDEALDKLQKSLKNAKIPESEKKAATEQLSGIIQDITIETDIENMIKAKGFVDCVTFKASDKVTVAVQTQSGELTKQEVAKVRDAVLNKTDITAQNIIVIGVK